jgi:glycosyltransferase involved in cell wall biosynthesis
MSFRRTHVTNRVMFVETSDVSVESHLDGLLGYLGSHGLDICVVSSDEGRLAQIAERNGARYFAVEMEREPSLRSDLASLLRVMKAVRRERPQLLIYGTPKASLLGAVAGWLCRVPNRVHLLHGLRVETMRGPARRICLRLERLVESLSTNSVAVGYELAGRAVEIGAARRRPLVLGHGSAQGVDATAFSPIASSNTNRSGFVIGFVGRVTADKGIDTLCRAFEQVQTAVPDVSLQLIGAHEGLHTLLPRTRDQLHNNPAIRVHGENGDVAELMRGFDVFCLPTRREGLPTVLMEAACSGVPIVATRATGVRDVVEEEDAWLVAIDDPVALAEAIISAYRNPHLRAERAQRAMGKSRARFERSVVWKIWLDFLHTQLRTDAADTAGKPRVLWLSKGLDEGGAETLLLELAKQEALRGYELHAASVLDGAMQLETRLRDAGVQVHSLGATRTLDVRWVLSLRRLIRSGRYSIVHSHSPLAAAAARVIARTVHPHPPTLTTEHNTSALNHPATRLVNAVTSRLDATRLAVSRAAADHQSVWDRRPIEVVYHGISKLEHRPTSSRERVDARTELGLNAADVVTMTIANMRPEKNLQLLLRAFVEVTESSKRAQLILVGDGAERYELAGLASSLRLGGQVRFLGRVPNARSLLVAADLAAMSSSYEGLPVFMMECLAAGLPIVSTRVGGVDELVLDGYNGLLVQPGDEAALARAITAMVDNDELRERMARNARKSSERFSISTAAERLNAIYCDLLRSQCRAFAR